MPAVSSTYNFSGSCGGAAPLPENLKEDHGVAVIGREWCHRARGYPKSEEMRRAAFRGSGGRASHRWRLEDWDDLPRSRERAFLIAPKTQRFFCGDGGGVNL